MKDRSDDPSHHERKDNKRYIIKNKTVRNMAFLKPVVGYLLEEMEGNVLFLIMHSTH